MFSKGKRIVLSVVLAAVTAIPSGCTRPPRTPQKVQGSPKHPPHMRDQREEDSRRWWEEERRAEQRRDDERRQRWHDEHLDRIRRGRPSVGPPR